MEEDSAYEASSFLQSQNLQASQMSQVQKSKFVYKEAPANSNLLENMDNNELLDNQESDTSSDEIDEDQAMKDLLMTDNGKEFMSFVNSRNGGLMKS